MTIARIVTALTLVSVSSPTDHSTAGAPRVFVLYGDHLAKTCQRIRQEPKRFQKALFVIRGDAEKALGQGPWSVMDKKRLPPSGDPHDYYSIGPYWWPDPAKPDGLPYIRRDGEVNPERHEYDNVGLKGTVAAVNELAFGYYFTSNDAYARHAVKLLRTWFLDPATRMNPHLEFGQAIPGRTQGRGIGIIDTACLVTLVDAVGLLETSASWTPAERRQLQEWFRAYLQWLLTSSHGKSERNTKNNHAVWYDAQVACFALFVGERTTARQLLEQVGSRRIATQIQPDGRMPHELARTKSFSYTHMNLRGFLNLARLAEHVQVDLWHYHTDDGRNIEVALDWLEPFVAERTPWTYQQIVPADLSRANLLYRRAALRLDKPAYRRLGANIEDPVDGLLWPSPRATD